MIQAVTLNLNPSNMALNDHEIQLLKSVFFRQEARLREHYILAVPNRSVEMDYWKSLLLDNQPTPNGIFYFIRWLADDDWFGPTRELYERCRCWQSRILCIGSASRWTREHDSAFKLTLKGLQDKSFEVVLSAIRGCAYSLRHEAIPSLEALRRNLVDKKHIRVSEAEIAIGRALTAIRTQNHHRYAGETPQVGLTMWPWDANKMYLAELDLNWRLRVLHGDLSRRLVDLGFTSLPAYASINCTETAFT